MLCLVSVQNEEVRSKSEKGNQDLLTLSSVLEHLSVLDPKNTPLLHIIHLFEDQSHVVAQLLEFSRWHLHRNTITC